MERYEFTDAKLMRENTRDRTSETQEYLKFEQNVLMLIESAACVGEYSTEVSWNDKHRLFALTNKLREFNYSFNATPKNNEGNGTIIIQW